jgi:hypothetical protein
LLSGYLSGIKEFDANEVEEVAREIYEETLGGSTQSFAGYSPAVPSTPTPYTNLNLPRFNTDGEEFEDPAAVLAGLSIEQFGERLARLERSLLQLEKINTTTLSLLQQLVTKGAQLNTPASSPENTEA